MNYFVTQLDSKNGKPTGPLFGPYASREKAIAAVPEVQTQVGQKLLEGELERVLGQGRGKGRRPKSRLYFDVVSEAVR